MTLMRAVAGTLRRCRQHDERPGRKCDRAVKATPKRDAVRNVKNCLDVTA
jgi:hypothetical protein